MAAWSGRWDNDAWVMTTRDKKISGFLADLRIRRVYSNEKYETLA
jgi:hypothetical protein